MMTQEEEKYYRDMFDLVATEGWKALVKDYKEQIDSLKIEAIPDEAVLRFVQGQLNILNSIINLEATLEASYNSAKEDEQYADADI